MAANSRGTTEHLMPKKLQDKEISPGRTKVWMERKSDKEKKVPVVYYLSRNGQLEHPHFIEVPLSSPQGLYLRDVINRLNSLRGQGMANMYSWSSKRVYRNGFVWQDLSENDFIYPSHGHEYILKGSLLLEASLSFRSYETVSSISSFSKSTSSERRSSSDDSNFPSVVRRKNLSWSTFDEHDEHKIYKAKTTGEFSRKATDVSTQTEENRRQMEDGSQVLKISPSEADIRDQKVENDGPSGRIKASAVLMQLIACGSRRVKDYESVGTKESGGCLLDKK